MDLSVVIASHNRRGLLRRCIEALRRQTQDPRSFEVIVANDGSTDGTAEMLERLHTPFRLRALRLEKVGQSVARNAGIRASRGTVCLLLGDDVVAAPELIAEHLAAHMENERILGIGRLTQPPPTGRDRYAHAFAKAWNRRYEGLADKLPSWTACDGGNLSVPRAALIEGGGFSTELAATSGTPDIELAFRLHQKGYLPKYLPLAHGVLNDQKRRGRLLADSRRQGAGHIELAQRHPTMTPQLLGWFGATTPREIVLRRVLLALRTPPVALAVMGRLIPGRNRQEVWFDFVSRFAYWRGVRRNMSRGPWVQITGGTPVLLYHAFGLTDESDRFVVTKRAFARQMWVLKRLRYRVIAFDELARTLREAQLPPRRAVVITIDDGYMDNIEIAHPILRRHRFPWTVFLVSEQLGGKNDWTEHGPLSGRPLLSLDQISRLRADDVRFGAHTRTHCYLPDVPDDAVSEEIEGSRDDLELRLGTSVTTFAYPFGGYDDRAVAAVSRTGFVGAGTVDARLVRLDDDPLLIPRIEVKNSDSLVRFLFKLSFGGS
jgi:peptidoglycan/xylan/chitin deacetylase (PgdA/CDA1 family)/GT2 family glycosyltransferase